MYNISWTRIVAWNLTGATRKIWTVEWLVTLISPLMLLHTYFLSFRSRSEVEIKTTGQVTKLEKYLNDRFDPSLIRIQIIDIVDGDPVFAFLASENRPLYLPVFLTGGTGYDFAVLVPAEYILQEADIKAILDHFKLPTTKYQIIYI